MRKIIWISLSVFVVFLDQYSKSWAMTNLLAYQPMPIFKMLNFTLAYNTGVAFSFFTSNGSAWHHWFFVGLSSAMSVFLLIWLMRLRPYINLQSLALSLILGGAIGNCYDRITLGYVVDFIDLYYHNHHWPIFNIADTAICIGVGLMLLHICINEKRTL